jgi:hypothetical protein
LGCRRSTIAVMAGRLAARKRPGSRWTRALRTTGSEGKRQSKIAVSSAQSSSSRVPRWVRRPGRGRHRRPHVIEMRLKQQSAEPGRRSWPKTCGSIGDGLDATEASVRTRAPSQAETEPRAQDRCAHRTSPSLRWKEDRALPDWSTGRRVPWNRLSCDDLPGKVLPMLPGTEPAMYQERLRIKSVFKTVRDVGRPRGDPLSLPFP